VKISVFETLEGENTWEKYDENIKINFRWKSCESV